MLARRLLTEDEQGRLGFLNGLCSREEEVLLRFSLKESVYKAIHPFLLRPVGFTEVEVDPNIDGTAKLRFLLKGGENFKYTATWQRYNEKYWLTCVYVHNRPNN
jgi:4'-phosphopantetheinyl transferase EntD